MIRPDRARPAAATCSGRSTTALPYDHEGLGCCIYLAGSLKLAGGRYDATIKARNRNTGLIFTGEEWGSYSAQSATRIAFTADSFVTHPVLLTVATVSTDTVLASLGGVRPERPAVPTFAPAAASWSPRRRLPNAVTTSEHIRHRCFMSVHLRGGSHP